MYQNVVYGVIFRLHPNAATCEELTQDAFIRAFDRIHQFEERSSFKSWLIRIAINLTKNYLTSYGYRNVQLVEDTQTVKSAEHSEPQSPEDRLAHQSLQSRLTELVQALPEKQRMAVILRIYEDMPFSEIAQAMNCPFDTAKANYRHGIENLKKIIFKKHKELSHELAESLNIFD